MTNRQGLVPPEYRPLHRYLVDRYADIVVLTFRQMEDLLGAALPEAAHVEAAWWANPGPESPASAQSSLWVNAHRVATPNLRARTVAFERQPA